MKFLSILFIFSLIIFNVSFAASDCPSIKTPFREIHLGTYGMHGFPEDDKLKCSDAIKVASIINYTKATLANSINTNFNFDLYFTNTSDNAFASIHLHIPKKLMIDSYSKHPIYTQPVWIHEYTHLVFNYNVSLRWKVFNYYNWYLTYTFETQLINFSLDKLDRLQSTPEIEKRKQLLEKNLAYYNKKINQFENDSNMPVSYEMYKLSLKYNELFSDIVAVSVMNNPNAISDAIRFTGLSSDFSQQFNYNRDFDDRRNQITRFEVDTEGAHNVLAAVRYHVWKYYLSNPNYTKYKSQVISKLLNAIIDEMKFMYQGKRNYDAKTLNQNLINRIDLSFTK